MIIRKVPGAMKWGDITLDRRLDTSQALWEWRKQVDRRRRRRGPAQRLDRGVTTRTGGEVARWNFESGWPSKWTGADFDAGHQRGGHREASPSPTKGWCGHDGPADRVPVHPAEGLRRRRRHAAPHRHHAAGLRPRRDRAAARPPGQGERGVRDGDRAGPGRHRARHGQPGHAQDHREPVRQRLQLPAGLLPDHQLPGRVASSTPWSPAPLSRETWWRRARPLRAWTTSGRRSPTSPTTCTGTSTGCSTSSTATGSGWSRRWPR